MTDQPPKLRKDGQPKQSGGPGRGQGRHPKAGKGQPTRKMISIRLDPRLVEWLGREEDATGLIERLLKQHYDLVNY